MLSGSTIFITERQRKKMAMTPGLESYKRIFKRSRLKTDRTLLRPE